MTITDNKQDKAWICTFEDDECDISQSSADDSYWYIPDNDGNRFYRPVINQEGDTYGTFATSILPLASYPSSGRGVLSFHFISNTDNPFRKHGYITVTTCEGGDPVLKLGNHKFAWYSIEVEFTCGSNPVEISFTAVRGFSLTYIRVDDIKVTEILTTTTGSIRSNRVIVPVVSSICIVLLICLIVTGYVFWRKRPTPIKDKDSDYNGDKLYTNPVYSSYDNAHSQPDLLVGTPTGHLSQETQQAHESIDEYEEFEGDSNQQLYSKPLRRQGSTERTGDNPTDIGENNVHGHAVLYDDEEYNALDFNRDKFPKITQNCPKSQTYKPSLPENSSETITDDAFGYGVLECPGVHGDDEYSSTAEAIEDPRRSTVDSKAPRYENSGPGAPSAADQMEEGPEYYSYQYSLEVRAKDRSSIEQVRSAAEAPREVDFEPIYSDEVYGDLQ